MIPAELETNKADQASGCVCWPFDISVMFSEFHLVAAVGVVAPQIFNFIFVPIELLHLVVSLIGGSERDSPIIPLQYVPANFLL